MWFWKRKPDSNDFPDGFRVQHIGVSDAMTVADLPPDRLAVYLRLHPATAEDLLSESYNKRFSPSTFIREDGDGFCVGWFSSGARYSVERRFTNLADAATDYLLFSLGKGRWTEPQTEAPPNPENR